jgi:hypothetical protein
VSAALAVGSRFTGSLSFFPIAKRGDLSSLPKLLRLTESTSQAQKETPTESSNEDTPLTPIGKAGKLSNLKET